MLTLFFSLPFRCIKSLVLCSILLVGLAPLQIASRALASPVNNEVKIYQQWAEKALDLENQGDTYGALQLTEKMHKRWGKSTLPAQFRADIVYNLAYLYYLYQDATRAKQVLTELLKTAGVSNNNIDHVLLLTRLLIETGDYQEAKQWLIRGLGVVNETENVQGYLGLLTNSLKVKTILNDSEREILSTSQRIFRKTTAGQYPLYQYHTYINLGNYYLKARQFADARKQYNLAKNICNRYKLNQLDYAENIAISYRDEGQLNLAAKEFTTLLDKNRGLISQKQEATIVQNYVGVLLKLGHWNEAQKQIAQAEKLLKYAGNLHSYQGEKVALLNLLYKKMLLEKGWQQPQKALKQALQVDALIDLMRQEQVERNSKVFWREKTHSFYEKALEICYELNDADRAFYFIEKSRAILLLDALSNLNAQQTLLPQQQLAEQQLRYQWLSLESQLNLLPDTSKAYLDLLPKLLEKKEAYQKFIGQLETTNPQYYSHKYKASYLQLPQLKAKLKQQQQDYITYFWGDSTLFALRISAEKVVLKKLHQTAIKQLLPRFLQLASTELTKSKWVDYQQVSFDMYQELLAPLGTLPPRVLISTDNFMLPFDALLTRAKGTRTDFLVNKSAITYAYSANVHFKESSKAQSKDLSLLGIAPERYAPQLNRASLLGSANSLELIANQGYSSKLLLHAKATKKEFLNQMPHFAVIQLYTHGQVDTLTGSSQIYFRDDLLKVEEFYGMKAIDADLVILSACETGIGQQLTGEGIQSIARGFSYVGVPSLVATLWSVVSQATYKLTEFFHAEIAKGKPKDIALQEAKKNYLATSANYSPYYWAGMVLVGETTPLNQSTPSMRWFVAAVLMAVVGLLIWRVRLPRI